MQAVATILPIILIVALGVGLRRWGMLNQQLTTAINRLVFYVGLPPFLFAEIAATPLELGPAARVFGVCAAVMAMLAMLGWVVARLRDLPAPGQAAVSQAAFRANTVFVGLPIIVFASDGHPDGAQIMQLGTLVLAGLVPLLNIGAVLVLSRADGRGAVPWHGQLRAVATNPMLLGSVAGLIIALIGWQLPQPIDRTARSLGQMALPLALLGIGASLNWGPLRRHLTDAVLTSLIKLGAAPVLAWLFMWWVGGDQRELFVAMLFMACPTAVISYIMAEQMRADAELTAAIIVFSTVASVIPLTLVLAMMI